MTCAESTLLRSPGLSMGGSEALARHKADLRQVLPYPDPRQLMT
ncbi:hypothetical protein C4K05_3697 [Pseudomonas chlororaphis subsp. aureofaciens]|uniref:Uncharacterized protein n=1 Tax=Pseudomonas chlororaphis subsp. aureofaciens TaxID=587851 RepID=A0AAD0ZK30_9PSED|nr:hypothetical protein C4K13_3799 [Pseudomonas chlororaphis subsp. aureofaciens]AZE30402.1 hypothetical protein C4K07_3619 [Pseudomonas chlororaphis subsp. aureofaciens]AZE36719.1 hypothetical protein C4K06_3688 [Pseudomonas chlororaphis subsp. aureofaciens]AZE43035.1 hypothetical protein C4K05_3697 [Pseudomonas chlororaphis subsp. aureofaciens]